MHQILLVEDDKKLSNILCRYFERNGFKVQAALTGEDAISLLPDAEPDIIILDLMLPGMDGLSICRQIRPIFHGKILFLTASDDDMDQVAALEMGADDYVCKPLQPRVLLARIRMLLRRLEDEQTKADSMIETSDRHPLLEGLNQLTFGALKLKQTVKLCQLNGHDIDLTSSEFDLLWLLASHANQPLPRDELVRKTRGIEYDGLDRTVDNRIVSLRKKLGDTSSPSRHIITIRGKGYLFASDGW
ncbi:two-component system, OmpR family, response regulator RstA [Oceanospirillum multiglobuliferum]|uniref:response regulator transcription factor n=1 Tax=Oceanospirillum multiglobuliferum TaxID=64969 RepID=UPI00099A359F|nr:response regulator transcription factor [Oceanospirillum multiglobuliferum]SKA09130.1 two-component system, OmpR family, response regulator RstA [Oceanospirillum multiglobuliferum]